MPLTIVRTFSITSAFGGPKRDEFLLGMFLGHLGMVPAA